MPGRKKCLERIYIVDYRAEYAMLRLKEFNVKKSKSTIKKGPDILNKDEKTLKSSCAKCGYICV